MGGEGGDRAGSSRQEMRLRLTAENAVKIMGTLACCCYGKPWNRNPGVASKTRVGKPRARLALLRDRSD